MSTVLDANRVITRLRSAFTHEADRATLLTLAATLIQDAGPPYTSVYLYMLHGDDLQLEAYAGRETDHTSIPVGKGVCGTAVATGLDQNVGDVQGRENYIACNLFTKSELVVLIRRAGKILGQIDVDSDVVDPFTPDEVAAVREVADGLAVLL
ncbi:MAG TPA: GAF domain-containing protein [Gemmatimonadales bacterium]|nr:GAF domain-containing protein [Gemmatimonadales bacterium]